MRKHTLLGTAALLLTLTVSSAPTLVFGQSALQQEYEAYQAEIAAWRVEVERQSKQPQWLTIYINLIKAEIVTLLDPMGTIIGEMAKDAPQSSSLEAKVAWLKLVANLLSSDAPRGPVTDMLSDFADGLPTEKIQELAKALVLQALKDSPQSSSRPVYDEPDGVDAPDYGGGGSGPGM